MSPVSGAAPGRDWWQDAVLYQVYPRSFADSNGDGIGDLPGIISRLDHLAWLGVDGLWLSPITASPNADWGYDVTDYCAVDPDYGTLADVDRLIDEAGWRGIRVLLDLVPNHTSDRHPWFLDARSSRSAEHRDWYVWADPKADDSHGNAHASPHGSPPNNWTSSFGGPAWSFDDATGQWYLHHFLAEQPDLNWWNEGVRESFEEILRFWFGRGVAGFRIDVCHMIVKDRELRDNPPATDDDDDMTRIRGQRLVYDCDRPELHELLRSWRRLARSFDEPRLLLGETHVFDFQVLAGFYGRDDELDLAFNFPFVWAPLDAEALRAVVEESEKALPASAWPVWAASNHDVSRFPTRWAGGDPGRTRCVLLLLLALRGTPVLYQGDEIGMPDTPLEREDILDPVGLRYWPDYAGRDPARTPMPWAAEPGAGFTAAGVKPWLPMGDVAACNVADQRADPGSVLTLCRDLLALRRDVASLRTGSYRSLPSPAGVWAWERGTDIVVAVNLSDEERAVDGVSGTVLLGTDRARDRSPVAGRLALPPGTGVIIRRGG